MSTDKSGSLESKYLTGDERIEMLPHDVIGIYFPNKNSIPYLTVPCDGSNNDHLRYKINPEKVKINSKFSFDIGPPSMHPCRIYSFNVGIGEYSK